MNPKEEEKKNVSESVVMFITIETNRWCIVHTTRILQSPPNPGIFNERGQPLSVTS